VLWSWLAHVLAIDSLTDRWAAWWDGAGSVLVPYVLSAATFGAIFWWHHQCAVQGCYWYARRTTAAGERACWRHHPHKKRTVKDIHDAHHAAVAAENSAGERRLGARLFGE